MTLRWELKDGAVALVTLDCPAARNALSAELRRALLETLERLARDPAVRALVLTGAGGSFCAGGDLKSMGGADPAADAARMDEVARCALALGGFPKPTVAAVAGHAAGAGVGLACLCDVVVAEQTAVFTLSFLRVGLGPDWGLSFTLPRRVGPAAARRLILTRAAVPAPEAHRLSLADQVTEPGAAESAALALAGELAQEPPEGIAQVKALMGDLADLRAALDAETGLQLARFRSAEHREGLAAFREKRPLDFSKDDR